MKSCLLQVLRESLAHIKFELEIILKFLISLALVDHGIQRSLCEETERLSHRFGIVYSWKVKAKVMHEFL